MFWRSSTSPPDKKGLPQTKSYLSKELVAHTGFEPVISSLRGRCPGPLDECARLADRSGLKSDSAVAAVTIIQQKYNRQHRAQMLSRGLLGTIPIWPHS